MKGCNLHVHSDYSCQDGAQRVEEIVQTVVKYNQPAVALTDHGTMAGALAFQRACKNANVKPLVGCEIYIDEELTGTPRANHLTVIAKNLDGYRALNSLISRANLTNSRYVGRVKLSWLFEHAGNLIILSGCLASTLRHLKDGDALEHVKLMQSVFKEDYYLEIQPEQNQDQKQLNDKCRCIGEHLGVKLVGTADAHYATCAHRARYKMINTFDYEDGDIDLSLRAELENPHVSLEIADKVQAYNIERKPILPTIAKEKSLRDIIMQRCPKNDVYIGRAKYELDVIERMGFEDYFLVLQDLFEFAKRENILMGPGRGSAAGSLVAYLLGITQVDSIKYNLLFERFLNPGRASMPDIDIDVQKSRRSEILLYLKNKYGQVFGMSNHSRIKAKTAIKDVMRQAGHTFEESNGVTKLLPMARAGFSFSLAESKDLSPDFAAWTNSNPELYNKALDIEGIIRGQGQHASAVCIVDQGQDVSHYCALRKGKLEEIPVSEFDMRDCESVGLVKFDVLGLRTLDVLNGVEDIEITGAAFDLICSGNTCGVFQLESGEMQRICKASRPRTIYDVAAILALYRPGPIESGMLDLYIHNSAKPWGIDCVDGALSYTRGVILYQEQIMEIARSLAGYSLSEADDLRKILGKKLIDKIALERDKFIKGALIKTSKDKAEALFSAIAEFAKYGFNKSHAVAYAFISVRTAEYKARYLAQFYAAEINSLTGKSDKIAKAIAQGLSEGVKFKRPNLQSEEYTTGNNGVVTLGLNTVAGIKTIALKAIVDHKPTKLLTLRKELGKSTVDKGSVKALIKACDLNEAISKTYMLEYLERLDMTKKALKELPPIVNSEDPLYQYDVEAFGVVLNPVSLTELERVRRIACADTLKGYGEKTTGVLIGVEKKNTRRGASFAVLTFQDEQGAVDLIAWPEIYGAIKAELKIASPYLIQRCGDSIRRLMRLQESRLQSPQQLD